MWSHLANYVQNIFQKKVNILKMLVTGNKRELKKKNRIELHCNRSWREQNKNYKRYFRENNA